MPQEMLRQFFEQAMSSGGRSTALKPLGWLLGILVFGLLAAPQVGLPEWVVVAFAAFAGLAALLYLGAYVYFMCRNPDALRSEKFTIEKMAIEHQLVGDSARGITKVDGLPSASIEPPPQLPDKDETDK